MDNAFGQPQNVIVLGATSDIARAITRRLCAARARHVVLAGRDPSRLDEAAAEARDYGATSVTTVVFDATHPDLAGETVRACLDALGGPVDLVLIAVGELGDQSRDQDDPARAAAMMTVNLTWPAAALSALRAPLVAQGHGRVVVLSSVAATRVRPSAYLYGAAKAGLDQMCLAMADTLDGTGVTLQIVRPGFVRSKMTTGLAEPPFTTGVSEVADVVVRGLESGDRVLYSPPILRYVFTILRVLPRRLWRLVADR